MRMSDARGSVCLPAMRVLIATTGSDGDVRPFLALARELTRRGHEVLFTAPEPFAPAAAELGLRFEKHGPSLLKAETEVVFARVLAAPSPLAQLALVMEEVAKQGRISLPELLQMVPQVDVVIYPPLLVAAAAAARACRVPHVSVQLAPVHRARNYGPTGDNLGPLVNRLMWAVAARVLRGATDEKLNVLVRAAGLAPWTNVLMEASSSALLDLVAVSPHVLERDPAWPAASQVTGYWFLDREDFVPSPELAAFVEGERPAVVGFGSMTGFDAQATTRKILEAVRDLPRKVIIQAGWVGLGDLKLPEHVYVTSFVPHAWLFARSACVVHHGGAGTTGAAFRAGIPQSIVWHLGDQPIWAKKARALGVSPGFISHKKLSSAWLRKQIDSMCSDRNMQERARVLGEQVRNENGVAVAADMIEQSLT